MKWQAMYEDEDNNRIYITWAETLHELLTILERELGSNIALQPDLTSRLKENDQRNIVIWYGELPN